MMMKPRSSRIVHRRRCNLIMTDMMMMITTMIMMITTTTTSVFGSIQDIDVILYPTDEFVQYTNAYIRGPGGSIDLSQLTFRPISQSAFDLMKQSIIGGGGDNMMMFDDDVYMDNDDGNRRYNRRLSQMPMSHYARRWMDEGENTTFTPLENNNITNTTAPINQGTDIKNNNNDTTPNAAPTTNTENVPTTATPTNSPQPPPPNDDNSNDDGAGGSDDGEIFDDFLQELIDGVDNEINGGTEQDSVIDIVIFPLPSYCMKDETKCQWSELGIGKLTPDDQELRWCCSEETVPLGLCTSNDIGRLLIDSNKFNGIQLSISVPYDGNEVIVKNDSSNEQQYIISEDKSADYAVMFGNCNTLYGRQVAVIGNLIFESKHGYLPGELYGFMLFYIMITFVYIILFVWYALLMKLNYESRIDIEKWIITAISLGCFEMVFRTLDYLIWNQNGIRSNAIIWIGILCGVFKQGFTRCLVVMVSMGWGVIRNSLSTLVMNVLIALTIAFIVVATLIDAAVLVAIEEVNQLSYKSESEILNVVSLLSAVKITIDIIFFVWMIDAIAKTLSYLSKQKNQVHKLIRTRQLRNIIVISFVLALIVGIVAMIDSYQSKKSNGSTMIHEEFAWAIDAAEEVIYLFVLVNIAILWRPNPNAKQYAYVMELGTSDDEHELELSAMDVPSAVHDDHMLT